MKKIISLLLVCAMVLSFSGCGSDNAAKEDTSATEKVTEEENTNKDTQKETNQEPAEEKLMTAAELDAKLAEFPISIVGTNYLVRGEGKTDMLQVFLQNDTGDDVKDVTVSMVAWDENGLPIKIKGGHDVDDGVFAPQYEMSGVNLTPNATFGKEGGYTIAPGCPVDTFKYVVVSYKDFNNTVHDNPYLDDFYKIYLEKRLKDIK